MSTSTSRLTSLLHIRGAERDQCRTELAEAIHARETIQQQLVELTRETQRLQHLARDASRPGSLNVDRLLNSHRYDLLLELRRQQLEQRRIATESVVQSRREALLAADQEFRMLEKLLEAESQRQQSAVRREEQNQLDEIAQRLVPSSGSP
jgi:flagellar export protein FliJ